MADSPERGVARSSESGTAAPLAGRTVMVTRTREQAAALAGLLESFGATVVPFPVITIVDPDDWGPADRAITHLADYDWLVLTSTNAVDRFLARARSSEAFRGIKLSQATAASGTRVAAVGSATAARLAERGVEVTVVPDDFRAEGLVEMFRSVLAGGEAPEAPIVGNAPSPPSGLPPGSWRVLIPRAAEAREILPETLREMGHVVDVVPVYRTVPAKPNRRGLDRLRGGSIDAITFTSGSTVRFFLAALEGAGLDPAQLTAGVVLASIGPVTTAALVKHGLKADVEAVESTMASLSRALADYYAPD
jgi:uroporphyrinogen III methyltransferase/synthase